MDQIFRSFRLLTIKTNLPYLHKFLDIVKNLISSRDLLRELSLMDHPFSSEQWKNKDLAKQSGRSMHLNRM